MYEWVFVVVVVFFPPLGKALTPCSGQDSSFDLDATEVAMEPRQLWHGRAMGIQVHTNASVSERVFE